MPHFLKINQFCFAYSFYWIPIDPGHRFRFVLKKWPPSPGLGGRHASESLAVLFRIPWLPCPGLCTLPPAANHLPVRIEAGEMKYHD